MVDTDVATNAGVTAAIVALALGTAATKNVGTAANNVVQLDGSAKLPAVDGSQLTNLPVTNGGRVLLAQGTIANSATSLDLVLTAYTGYRDIVIELFGLLPATNNVDLQARLSTDGGATYDSAASSYDWALFGVHGSAAVTAGSGITPATFMQLNGNPSAGIGNGAGAGANVVLEIKDHTNTAVFTKITSEMFGSKSAAGTPQPFKYSMYGARLANQDTDAIRFLWSSGNFAASNPGTYRVYGRN